MRLLPGSGIEFEMMLYQALLVQNDRKIELP